MIFKIQLPVCTNEPEPFALVYNQDRSIEFGVPIDTVEEWFIHDPHKIFVEADFQRAQNKLLIREIVEDEEW